MAVIEATTVETIVQRYDIWSCVKADSERLRAVLLKRGRLTKLDDGSVSLLIRFRDGLTIIMDRHGVVQAGGVSYKLCEADFSELKSILADALPPPPGRQTSRDAPGEAS